MIDQSLAQPAHPTTDAVADAAAAAVEAEFDRLKRARPHLLKRIERAEDILVTHLSCKRAGIIKPRVRGGELVGYLVAGSGGTVYKVDPVTFTCSCPDHHRRGGTCKHAIACYALGRAYQKPSTPPPARTLPCVSCGDRFRGRDLIEVGDDHLTFFEGDRLCRSCAIVHGVL